jgi:hypothetical protein
MSPGSGQDTATSTLSPARSAASERSYELMSEAEQISAELARVGAAGVIVFGSAARGTATEISDLDLLVLWEQPYPIPVMPDEINLPDTDTKWNLLVCKERRLQDPGIRWSLYKQAASEAVYLHDPDNRFKSIMEGLSEATPEFCRDESRYLDERLQELRAENFADPKECYKWAKAAIMQLNLVEAVPTGERSQAFAAFSDRYPRMRSAVDVLGDYKARKADPRQLADATEVLVSFVSGQLNNYARSLQ